MSLKSLLSAAEGLIQRRAVRLLRRSLIMLQTFISRHSSNFLSYKLFLPSVTPASSVPILQTPKDTSSSLSFNKLKINAGHDVIIHVIQMNTSINAKQQGNSEATALTQHAYHQHIT